MNKEEKDHNQMSFVAVIEFYKQRLREVGLEETGARDFMRSEGSTEPSDRLKFALEEKERLTIVYASCRTIFSRSTEVRNSKRRVFS